MLTLAVLLIFTAMVGVIAWSTPRDDSRPRPIPLRHDEQSQHHRRNLPGPGAD
jgi:hypothetical protein